MLGVAYITDTLREVSLRYYVQVMRKENEIWMKRTMMAEVNGRRS